MMRTNHLEGAITTQYDIPGWLLGFSQRHRPRLISGLQRAIRDDRESPLFVIIPVESNDGRDGDSKHVRHSPRVL